MKTKTTLIAIALASLVSCTENQSAKGFGGTATIDMPPGTKFVCATWKEANLWYVYRPSREGEKPETVTMQEDSNFGVLEGKVIFQER